MSQNVEVRRGTVWLVKAAPLDEADPYSLALQQRGFTCITLPVLDFAFCNLPELRKCCLDSQAYSGLVLTSPRCVEAIAISGGLQSSKEQKMWSEKSVYTVGPATSNAAKESLNIETKGEEAGNAKNLAEVIVKDWKCKSKREASLPLLFPCSSVKRDALPEALKQAHIPLHSMDVYVTGPHPKLKENIRKAIDLRGYPEFCIFFSPSGVRYFSSAAKHWSIPLHRLKMVSLGPTTAEAIKCQEWNIHAIAEKQTPEHIVKALLSE